MVCRVLCQVSVYEAHRSWLDVAVGALQDSTDVTAPIHNDHANMQQLSKQTAFLNRSHTVEVIKAEIVSSQMQTLLPLLTPLTGTSMLQILNRTNATLSL